MRYKLAIILAVAAVAFSCGPPTDSIPASTPVATTAPELTPINPDHVYPPIVQVEFPDEIDESIQLADLIAQSDVIAIAEFKSMDTAVALLSDEPLGYESILLYHFSVVEYLKGGDEGREELTVLVASGPIGRGYDSFSYRSKEEAEKLAAEWLSGVGDRAEYEKEAILFLRASPDETELRFRTILSDPYGKDTIFGETWLPAIDDSTHFLNISGVPLSSVSLDYLNSLIEVLEPHATGRYAECVSTVLAYRERVRSQFLGTHVEYLGFGKYVKPDPFPREEAALHSPVDADTLISKFINPPYSTRTPRLSHYWLDGEDKDLFDIYVISDTERNSVAVIAKEALPPGEYSVLVSGSHQSLPCDAPYSEDHTWWGWNTTKLAMEVVAP